MTQAEKLKLYKFEYESLIDSHSRLAFELYHARMRILELEKERSRLERIALESRKRWWDFLLF